MGYFRQFHHSGHRNRDPRLSLLGRRALFRLWHLRHACDWSSSDPSQFRATALRGRFPLLARASPGIRRASGLAGWRKARTPLPDGPLRQCDPEFLRHCRTPQAINDVHRQLRPDQPDHSLCRSSALLLHRQDTAWCSHTNRQFLRSGRRLVELLHRCLCLPGRLSLGHPASCDF